MPQALNYALPNLSTIIIGLLKDGSFAFTIGLIDVFGPLFNGFFFYPKLRTLLYTIKMSEYKIVENQLNAEDFKALFKDAGWGNPCEKMFEVSLKKSYATFSVLDGDKVIGCARLLGDGSMAFFVKDVIIKSEFRGKGIGKMLMTYIEDFIKRQIEPGWWTCVELMSAGGKEPFYEKLGFERRPTENRGAGMMKMVVREEK